MSPRRALYTLILLAVVLTGLIVGALSLSAPAADAPTQMITLDPTVRANVRDLPNAPPLTGDLAESVNMLAAAVSACPDYDPRRRVQMEQHIAWLLRPADIPRALIPAFGANPQERLLFGMATFTQIDWQAGGSRRDSCLFAIGRQVNALLAQVGGEPVAAFSS
jgi:hypothetical protein